MGIGNLKNIDKWLTYQTKIDTNPPAVRKVNHNQELEQRVAAQNRDLSPKYLDTATSGSAFTHGVGAYNFGKMRPFLA